MTYALESPKEFERLENQATQPNYDYRKELSALDIKGPARVIDAGCGSGVVSRYLAQKFPRTNVTGFDLCESRVSQAKESARDIRNLEFRTASLTQLPIESNSTDIVVCRFVLEHLSPVEQRNVLKDLFRCLKPGGKLYAIDIDGWFHNLFPSTGWIDEVSRKFDRENPIDLRVGRKMPSLLAETGFQISNVRIDLMHFEGQDLEHEKALIRSRIEQAYSFLCSFLGSAEKADRFRNDLMKCLSTPQAVLFYSKFVVTGVKPQQADLISFKR